MQKTITIQEVGKRPTLDKLPILLQQPVELATNYLCVASVDYIQFDGQNFIAFRFDEDLQMEVNTILEIFNSFQFQIPMKLVDPLCRFMFICVEPSKALLN
ncbi:hypothetical protein [Flavobacterium suncheonense]|uniref:Uncharacterized protein n=1 Tax=Flavobacterium suncheonense GH29-5 = DSM 17707 TaxID=1121899 RepID=A0A0A2MD79_9FLAO|nr:hypothetical protein [Flavobacterium suncheonense]KGO89571.1 hypothetical protein Q764_07315 [Flavobacterium suncheonense GH29-5 = DSM 17707]